MCKKFGRLRVVAEAPNGKKNHARWLCVCDCGKETTVYARGLRKGTTKSCNCLQRELSSIQSKARSTTHGHASHSNRSREYNTWSTMKTRCLNKNYPKYNNHGGRGITICDRWRHSFENFLADMGPRPKNTSIDRIDVNGNYEPGNCRWATPLQQRHNQRKRTPL